MGLLGLISAMLILTFLLVATSMRAVWWVLISPEAALTVLRGVELNLILVECWVTDLFLTGLDAK